MKYDFLQLLNSPHYDTSLFKQVECIEHDHNSDTGVIACREVMAAVPAVEELCPFFIKLVTCTNVVKNLWGICRCLRVS